MPHPAGAALAFAAALLCAAACQRFPKGGIEGTVRDHSGAPIANVHVGIVGLAHSGPSDASGRYRLARVPVGTHRPPPPSVMCPSNGTAWSSGRASPPEWISRSIGCGPDSGSPPRRARTGQQS